MVRMNDTKVSTVKQVACNSPSKHRLTWNLIKAKLRHFQARNSSKHKTQISDIAKFHGAAGQEKNLNYHPMFGQKEVPTNVKYA